MVFDSDEPMEHPLLRWGILGCANIARKNWKAIWNSQNGQVIAVASRTLERSRGFIAECQTHAPFQPAPRALGSYEDLLMAPDVDAVYIPLPTAIRGQWVKRAAEFGKHVVCEKPCATSVVELADLLDTCRRNHVQFMDGVMFMHSRRLERIREVLRDGKTIGPVRRISSAFSFRGSEEFFASNIRTRSDLEPYGCLGDLGWYCIRFALWAMSWELPQRVIGRVLSEYKQPVGPLPVPTEFEAELFFAEGATCNFYCSFFTETEQWVNVSGENGYFRVPDFVLPFSGPEIAFETGNPVYEVHGCDFEMQPHSRRWVVEEYSHSHPSAQESQLFRHFADQLRSGTLNSGWPEMALKTQQVMQACYESSLRQGCEVKVDESLGARRSSL
jgi:predicted dehydrogenase